jgi:hypothetical protein
MSLFRMTKHMNARKCHSQMKGYCRILNLQEPCFLCIGQAYHYSPNVAFYIFFQQIPCISSEYFKHAAHSPFFSSYCHLFHNATFFGSCVIHILHTGCAKI